MFKGFRISRDDEELLEDTHCLAEECLVVLNDLEEHLNELLIRDESLR